MKNNLLPIFFFLFILNRSNAQEIFEWRMENRTGVSSEKGLLELWPDEGPGLLWSNLELPKGFSSPSFGNNALFITGFKDSVDILVALDMSGKLLWQTPMGRAWTKSYPESRSTPTVEGNKVYTCSGFGDLYCFDATNGQVVWSYKASELNKGTYGRWGIAESLLIDNEKIYFSPGGYETMAIALNKTTGELIWKSESINDRPTYVSPILIEYANRKIIINTSMGYIFAIDASNGEILWKIEQILPKDFNPHWEVIKCVSPLYNDGKVYITGGYDIGGIMIDLTDNGNSAKVLWRDSLRDVHHGGAVLLDGYIYGSNWLNNGNGNWCCIEWNTGKKMWEEHWNCKGSVIAAENMLYIYDEKRGNTGLVKASPEKFDLISSFRVTQGSGGPYWAHPVIHNGILYLRHGNALMAYNIKEN